MLSQHLAVSLVHVLKHHGPLYLAKWPQSGAKDCFVLAGREAYPRWPDLVFRGALVEMEWGGFPSLRAFYRIKSFGLTTELPSVCLEKGLRNDMTNRAKMT